MSDVYDSDMSVNKLIGLWRQVFMLIFSVFYERFLLYYWQFMFCFSSRSSVSSTSEGNFTTES